MTLSDSKTKAPGMVVHLANWRVDDDVYSGMMSFFDRSATSELIEGLQIV